MVQVIKRGDSTRTVMYSYGGKGEVVVHELPFDANNKFGFEKLERYLARGFMFDDPRKAGDLPFELASTITTKEVLATFPIPCPKCGKECKSLFGLSVHMRVHKEE